MTDFEKARIKREKKTNKFDKEKFKMQMLNGKYEFYFFIFPIAIILIAFFELKDWNYNRMKWDTKKAIKVLDKVLPVLVKYNKDNDTYYLDVDCRFIYGVCHHSTLRLRTWAKKYSYKLKEFLVNEYQNNDYSKVIEKDMYNTIVVFKRKEE